jgi:FkbM family methyltransferase
MNTKPVYKTIDDLIKENNITLKNDDDFFYIQKENKIIKISHSHKVYLKTLMRFFDFHFMSVSPEKIEDNLLVDFSKARNHKIIGFDLFDVKCPSLAEPYGTVMQYVEIANLKHDDVVLDLGAYSGLTSIAFSLLVGKQGKVVAVEADDDNYNCLIENINKLVYHENIIPLNAAVWNVSGALEFSSENSMGSSAVSIVGERGSIKKVKCLTLSDIAEDNNLNKIDFIKCDVEGAEIHIFDDDKFFDKYKPRILLETHIVNGEFCDLICIEKLAKFGYKYKQIKQFGLDLPLLEFYI